MKVFNVITFVEKQGSV